MLCILLSVLQIVLLDAPLSPTCPNRSYLHAIFIFSSFALDPILLRLFSIATAGRSRTQPSPTPTTCKTWPWQIPSAAKFRRRTLENSVLPDSSTMRLVPRASPACPPSNSSSDAVPVEVTGCDVRGDGRTPGRLLVLALSECAGGLSGVPTGMLRLRKAMALVVEND
jgi:hypothetical protein